MTLEHIQKIRSPYLNTPSPMCYPGSMVPQDICNAISHVLPHNMNLIGTHSYTTSQEGEGGFEYVQNIERQVIEKLSHLYSLPEHFITLDGYFCTGGTEAN